MSNKSKKSTLEKRAVFLTEGRVGVTTSSSLLISPVYSSQHLRLTQLQGNHPISGSGRRLVVLNETNVSLIGLNPFREHVSRPQTELQNKQSLKTSRSDDPVYLKCVDRPPDGRAAAHRSEFHP